MTTRSKPLRHEKRDQVRKERIKSRARAWSPNRPEPAKKLSLFDELMVQARKTMKNMSSFDVADTTGMSPSTIRKHFNGDVRLPHGRSIQMWLDALGGTVRIEFAKRSDD